MNNKIIKELCIGNIDDVLKIEVSQKNNFERFETCSCLEKGGYTPEVKTYEYIKENFENHDQIIMIRNTESFILKDENKINDLIKDINVFLNLGAKNFIFGYINENKEIDIELCTKLIKEVKKNNDTSYCFHMAIDEVDDYDKAFKTLIKLGFKRVLTKGGKTPAINNIDNLKKLNDKYGNQIEILVGGKVDANNYLEICKLTNIKQVHGTKII